ncbi:MAG: Ldh family oxidoreductase [Planctomycetaceae bacterium]|nr:Ldh family oxidoreductase [Planctomycetaceae bacterium]
MERIFTPMPETLDIPSDPQQETVVQMGPLRELMIRLYVRKGVYQAEAEIAADRQIEADLRGIHSHGSRATPRYLVAMDLGDVDPRGVSLVIRQTPAMAVLDGSRNLGHVTSTKAMLMAIEMARQVGTGTVAVRNSQHYGAASVYALLAAKAGMIGYTTTSTGMATVAAYGSRLPATANNAFAWAAPVRSGTAFCLDMACAVSSWGKVQSLGMYGLSIPPGWALDADGHPTTEAATAKTLLPASGARGYGLAFVSSILAGPLVGGRMPLHKSARTEAEGSEHFFYAIDISKFVEIETFYDEIERTMADIRALPPTEGFGRVTLPGELESERAERWAREGIPLHRDHLRELGEVAAKMKIAVPW